MANSNCGIGPGGFQSGNKCAKGGGWSNASSKGSRQDRHIWQTKPNKAKAKSMLEGYDALAEAHPNMTHTQKGLFGAFIAERRVWTGTTGGFGPSLAALLVRAGKNNGLGILKYPNAANYIKAWNNHQQFLPERVREKLKIEDVLSALELKAPETDWRPNEITPEDYYV